MTKRQDGILLLAFFLPAVLAFFSHVYQEHVALFAYTLTKLIMIIFPLWIWRTKIIKQKPKTTYYALCIGSGIILAALLFLGADANIELIKPLGVHMKKTLSRIGLYEYFWLYALGIIFINSLLEEWYWRYGIFNLLEKRMSIWNAIILSSFSFALVHAMYFYGFFGSIDITMILTTGSFLFGLFWCWLYTKIRNVLWVWINHIFIDCAIIAIEYKILFS